MKSSDEMINDLLKRRDQYEADQKEHRVSRVKKEAGDTENNAVRSQRWSVIAAVLALIVVVGVSIGVYLGAGKKKGSEGTTAVTATVTPEAVVTTTPTPVPATPTPTEEPDYEPEDWSFLQGQYDFMPPVGILEVPRPEFQEAIRNNPDPDGYYYVKITFSVWDDNLEEFFSYEGKSYREWADILNGNALVYAYNKERQEYYEWLDDPNPDPPIPDDLEPFDTIFRKKYGEEGWEEYKRVTETCSVALEAHYKWRNSEEFRQLKEDVYKAEFEKVQSLGVRILSVSENCGQLEVLITRKQILQLLGSEKCGYTLYIHRNKPSGLEGFTVIFPTPTPTPANSVVIDSSIEKIDQGLYGTYDADEIVRVYVSLGDFWEEGQRVFREQYPEEYAAYIWLKNEENPVDNDDPRVELALRGSSLRNSLPNDLEQEAHEKFFKNHPEYEKYRVDLDFGMMELDIPYGKLADLAAESEIVSIGRVGVWNSCIEAVGEYEGHKVYCVVGDDDGFFVD